VPQGLGGGRYAVPSRHGQKGGNRCDGWYGDDGRGGLRQWRDHRGGVGFRDAEPLGQGGQGAGRSIAEGAQRREEGGEEDVDPLIRFALDHTKQAPLYHLKRIGLEVDQNEEQPIFRGR
jgi:hypothetical protein